MTYRKTKIVPAQIYHVFNRSVAQVPIFTSERDFKRFAEIVDYYRFTSLPFRFSHYNRLEKGARKSLLKELYQKEKILIEIYSFCFMPNHFHFLIKELEENGTRKFISNIQNSYAKYFNTKNERSGSLFQEMFKAVRIESDEQFVHVARYIHLNPYSAFILDNINSIKVFPWSSFGDYLGTNSHSFVNCSFLSSFFKASVNLEKFTLDQAEYQRNLEKIKHLILE